MIDMKNKMIKYFQMTEATQNKQVKGEEPLKELSGTPNNMSKRFDKFQEILLVKKKLLKDISDYMSGKINKLANT